MHNKKIIISLAVLAILCLASIVFQQKKTIPPEKTLAQVNSKIATMHFKKEINLKNLPYPTIEFKDGKEIFDFKDNIQKVWIVAIVNPDGSIEISYTEI